MCNATDPLHETDPPPLLPASTLAESVMILAVLSVVQRLIGFCRAMLFCRWLPPEQLGEWDIAFGFLMAAPPIAVLSLSGSLGRYVEYYRQRGQLRSLLKRTAAACLALAVAAAAAIFACDRWFSSLLFSTPDRTDLVRLLAVSLLLVVAFNYVYDLCAALRNARMIAVLQLVNGLLFAALGVGLIGLWQNSARSVIVAYAGACAVSAAVGVGWLVRYGREIRQDVPPPAHAGFWARLVTYSAWIWVACAIANLFDVVDRYLIVHCSTWTPAEALARVGEYHASRIIPLLMISLAMVLASIITPHLSHDWEAGRRDRVHAQLNLFLKLFGFALTVGCVLVLFAAPWLFSLAFHGKYPGAIGILPLTLAYCLWFSLLATLQTYALCCEKSYLTSVSLLAGLGVNVGLNLLLLPRFGLPGAVLATTVGNAVALLLVVFSCRMLGFRMDRGTWVVLLLPATFMLGPWPSLAFVLIVALDAFRSEQLLSRDQKALIAQSCTQYLSRFGLLRTAVK